MCDLLTRMNVSRYENGTSLAHCDHVLKESLDNYRAEHGNKDCHVDKETRKKIPVFWRSFTETSLTTQEAQRSYAAASECSYNFQKYLHEHDTITIVT